MNRPTETPRSVGLGQRARALVERWAQERGASPSDGLRYWQEQTLDALLLVGVVLGVLTWLPSVVLALYEYLYGIAALDTLLLLAAIFLLLRRNLSYAVRATGAVVICYAIGLVLLLVLGPFSGGPVWLFIPPVLAGIFGGARASVAALFVNALTMVAVAFLADIGVLTPPAIEHLQARWLVCCVNFLLLNTMAAAGVALVVQGLQGSLEEEFRVRESLKEKHGELSAAHDRLAIEVTQRRQAEDRLRDHRDQLETIVAKRTADLQFRNEEMRLFAYSVSHDLRSPLRTIAGFGELLLAEQGASLDETGRGYLERMRAGARRMDSLIDGMLGLSRSSRAEMRNEVVDISELAAAIVADLRRRDPERAVDVEIAPSLVVRGDRSLLGSALENLLGNAWKFTGRRERGCIELAAVPLDAAANGDSTYFIRDNGAGFDMHYAGKLFGAFQRLHANSEFPGTGVGLAIVRRIIERHGGRVWAQAEIDKGATFFFSLPAHDRDVQSGA